MQQKIYQLPIIQEYFYMRFTVTKIKATLFLFGLLIISMPLYASTKTNIQPNPTDISTKNVVKQRADAEKKGTNNPFFISFYKPTYLLPFYYTSNPFYSIYQNNTPNAQKIKNTEVSFQFSFKVPIVRNIFRNGTNFYIAYSQVSFWQAYNNSPFFRETNYEPEMFIANEVNWRLFNGWALNFLNFGFVNQSNGRGGINERSWNRVYTDLTFANGNWMVDVRPWFIVHDHSFNTYNPNIGTYLGYERTIFAYKHNRQEFSLETRNTVESGFKHAAYQFTWSFPITSHINGFFLVFSGYGQSLIEYNHYTNSVGIGIALSNWV
jgi:phospholipase A1